MVKFKCWKVVFLILYQLIAINVTQLPMKSNVERFITMIRTYLDWTLILSKLFVLILKLGCIIVLWNSGDAVSLEKVGYSIISFLWLHILFVKVGLRVLSAWFAIVLVDFVRIVRKFVCSVKVLEGCFFIILVSN